MKKKKLTEKQKEEIEKTIKAYMKVALWMAVSNSVDNMFDKKKAKK
jgi:hypothetical protein